MNILDQVKIVFENEDFMCVDKPAGLVVHSDGRTVEKSLVDWLEEKFLEGGGEAAALTQRNIGRPHTLDSERYTERWGIVNRLDRDTAGLILIAKNQRTFDELQNLFQKHEIVKKYEALVWGQVDFGSKNELEINEKISRHKTDPRILTCGFTSVEGGRKTGLSATTVVRVIKTFPTQTLLELEPKTGRTHQLRLHSRFLGHPIVGDDKYGLNGKINEHSIRQISALLPLLVEEGLGEVDEKEKLKLVAKSLEFELSGNKFFFESRIGFDL